jgi:ribosomal protein L22
MSAEDEQDVEREEAPAEAAETPEPSAEAADKPARARKAAAKAEEPATKKPAVKKPAAEKSAAEEPAAKKPAAKKPAAKKPAAKAAGTKAAERDDDAAEKEKPATPARRAAGSASAPSRQVVRARARYVRTSARKARMVCGHLRGKSVPEARAILAFTPREVARSWSKLLESAVANAENNHELLEDDLIVREAYADEGPTIKRFRPRAMGRATPIRKRTSHLTITLTPRP